LSLNDPIDEAGAVVDAATAEVERLRSTSAPLDALREAERALRQAKRRLMFARVGATERSEHLEDTGAPPGSHEKKA
jgi:hypothetical protein